MLDSTKLYRWLLKLYPAQFREEYQEPMARQFCDEYRDRNGSRERLRFWLRAILDLAESVPAELFRELGRDFTHSFRLYRKRPLTTLLALTALGLAIGLSTGVFSVLNALLLRPLPFENPKQLVELMSPPIGPMDGRPAFNKWHRQSLYLETAATFTTSEMNLAGERDALRLKVAETSANLFQTLGVKCVLGRSFTQDEDIPGHNAIAVIGYGLWQQLFAGDPGVAGRTLNVNGTPLTVIGVAPPNFDYPDKANIWMPTIYDFEKTPRRGAFLIHCIGRLKPGISIQKANEFFEAELRRAKRQESVGLANADQNRPHLISIQTQVAGAVRPASWVLAGMTLLILLTACANVAQLLLSRATERRQDLAVRAALGASRARLLQQSVMEALTLTTIGAALGLLVALWTSRIVASVAPAQLATQAYTIVDWRVLCFAAALALGMGMATGVLPGWLIGRVEPSGYLARSQPGVRDLGTNRVRWSLLFIQAALAVCLANSSLSMGRTFLRLISANLGFRPTNVVTLNVSLQGSKHKGAGEWRYYSEALNRLRSIPGVEAAGAVSHLPLAHDIYMAFPFKLDSGVALDHIVVNAVSPGYFHAMETRFVAGRDFAENEMQHSERAVIVNEAFAQSAKLDRAIVGRRLIAPWSKSPYRIIGLVRTVKAAGPANPGGPAIYWLLQEEPPPAVTLVARVAGPAESYLPRCRDVVRSIDRSIPIYDVKTLDRRLADVLARPRFYTAATLFLAVLAVLLASVGIFGTAAHAIAQRRHEIGVRMAIGASYGRIRNMIVRGCLLPIVYGSILGMALSLVSSRYLAHLVENVSSPGVWISAVAALLLVLTGLAASWGATGRILAIPPIEALRAE